VAGVVAELRPPVGFTGTVTTTLPVGAGLSSSAALEVAVALALGFDGDPLDLARLTQRAEQVASGVPCGIMDQLASAAGVDGHALLIDCHSLAITPVPVPDGAEIRVVHSGQARELASSAYAERAASVHAAEAVVGPLRLVHDIDALDVIEDELLRRRARHVVTENARVRRAPAPLQAGDLAHAGPGHGRQPPSLRDDFEVSTDVLDAPGRAPHRHPGRARGPPHRRRLRRLRGGPHRTGGAHEGWAVRASRGAHLL
jgi:galactokinase